MDSFELNNTIKTEIVFKSDGVDTDPSGNKAFVTVYKPDGTTLINGASGSRSEKGKYYYYFNTEPTDPLGIYTIEWSGYHELGGIYGYKPIIQRDIINIVEVEM